MEDDLDALLARTVERILAAPPSAMRYAKHCVDGGMKTDLATGIEIEMEAIRSSLSEEEWKHGLNAFSKRTEA